MSILTCDNISYAIGVKEILSDVTFAVNPGAKVGVIGVNGAGKTTLFSIIRGALEPTGGAVYLQKDTEMGCLEQINDNKQFSKSIYETALEAFDGLIAMEEQINVLNERIASGDESVINRFTELNEKYLREGGNEFRGKTAAILKKFGFGEEEFGSPAQYLSGGQKTKLLLARLLLRESDIILLDEPTNHLDIEAIEWLENFVRNSKKTFLIVSHDRFFLDRVTTDTLEIEHGKCRMHSGNYSAFKEKKRQLLEAQLKHYEQQQKEIKRIEAFIENQRRWNREKNIIAAESREKALARMVKIEKPKNAPKSVAFKIAGSSSSAQEVLSVRGLSKGYGGVSLFKDLSFELRHGNRLFVVGANGSGKSTLLKILTGRETADSGVFEPGYNQSIGYYDQEQQLLDLENTVLDEIWGVYADKTMSEVRGMLASFGFYGEDVFKQVSVLSGGERARLSIAKMISCGVSLLILDEPTNHLDIASREWVEAAIEEFEGVLLFVSHDRYFIEKFAERIWVLEDGTIKDYPCGYAKYRSILDHEAMAKPATATEAKPKKEKPKGGTKELDKLIRRLEREIEKQEGIVAELDSRIEQSGADYQELTRLLGEKEDAENVLLSLMEQWEEAQM